MPFGPNIDDVKTYNHRMEKSLIDKIFWVDKVDSSIIVDYGCADGVLLKALQKLFPDYTYIGYDISSEMIKIANDGSEGILFTTSWDEVTSTLSKLEGKKTIVLNSLLHEVYHYLSADEIDAFWKRIWESQFDYVCVRDMMVAESTSRPSDPLAVARIRQLFDKQKLAQWEGRWGSLNENWSLTHFLLSYHYSDSSSWEREYKENYLSNSLETFMQLIPKEYFPHFMEHYTLPFIRSKVMKDFNIQLQDRTHIKLILSKEPF